MRHLLVVLGLIPGLGQAHTGAPMKGAFHLVLFLVSLNAFFMAPFWLPRSEMMGLLQAGSLLLAALIWGYSFFDLIHRLYHDSEERSTERNESDGNQK